MPTENVSADCKIETATMEPILEETKAPHDGEVISANLEIHEILKNLETQSQLLLTKIEVEMITNLQTLNLSNLALEEIPATVFVLKQIKHLNISKNKIQTLPDGIGLLSSLHELNVSENQLEVLPSALKRLVNLRNVNVASNKLVTIPEGMEHLHQLEILSLSRNNISETPDIFCRSLRSITHLDLSYNKLKHIGNVRTPLCAAKLQFLDLSHNNLDKIPSWLFTSCRCLIHLDLSYNIDMNGTQEELSSLQFYNPYGGISNTLRYLNLSDCNLLINESFDLFKKFSNLDQLHLGNATYLPKMVKNLIYDVPTTLLSISTLTELYVPAASINYLPENISKLTSLKILDLTNNEINWLSDSFCKLRSLRKCFLSENRLVGLPKTIGQLEALTELTLSKNCELYFLPDSFKQLRNLEYLDLYDNHLDEIPEVLLNLPALRGLDLEMNLCQTENRPVQTLVNYDEMRQAMRKRVPHADLRVNGVKVMIEPYPESPPAGGSWSSWTGGLEDDDLDYPDGDVFIPPLEESYTTTTERAVSEDENWGHVVEDTEWAPPGTKYEFKLCAELVHPRPRPWGVVTHRRRHFTVEEGQFEDD